MNNLESIGAGWLKDQVGGLTDHIERVTPSEFNEANRYLPESVTAYPGYIRYSVNPYMREIVDCFDVNSPVREVNLKKGVQITYTTVLESGLFYLMAHVRTVPVMYMTADKELADARIENNIIPMLNESGFADIIRSSDIGSSRKTGKTKNHLQWEGGGYLVPFGARNATKMRQFSILAMLKDELDTWPDTVGKDGDPDALSDDRCAGYWVRRKIFRGSTPLIKGSSKIQAAFLRGDQREYLVLCQGHCNAPQKLRWSGTNEETGHEYGFHWEMDNGVLIPESVCYRCKECGHEHFEHDKERLFAEDQGAHWNPTARPAEPDIRSYHLPALYSPIGMQPWSKSVAAYLKGYDPVEKRVIDIGKYQVFYNNVLAEPFEVMGAKVTFAMVSAHRRAVYRLGQVPNNYAAKWSGGTIQFLTCTVDVHKGNLAVAVIGWTRDARSYLVDYWRFEDETGEEDGCTRPESPVWGRLRELLEETTYEADNGDVYRIALTLVDSGYANDTVCGFCAEYESGVYPILGRPVTAKHGSIKEFAEFETQVGTLGYKVYVDYYKDRLAPVLRRDWVEESGEQKRYHFNAGIDTTDKQLKELTREVKREKKDELGHVSHEWYRPGNAHNELWDLLVYGHAAVSIMARSICIEQFELETVDWDKFWDYVEGERLFIESV